MAKKGDRAIPESGRRLSFEEDIEFIEQLVDVLEEAQERLERSYSRKDFEDFADTKRFMGQIQKKIEEVIG